VHQVRAWSPSFVVVGQRTDLDLNVPLDFGAGWQAALRDTCVQHASLSHHSALDLFLFPRGIYTDLPNFAIGRPAWDNWLVMHTLRRRIPLVDISNAVLLVHQNHGYGHLKVSTGQVWEGPEADSNRAAAREDAADFRPHQYTVLSATHVLRNGRVRYALRSRHLRWRLRVAFERLIEHAVTIDSLRRIVALVHLLKRLVGLAWMALRYPRGRQAIPLALFLLIHPRSSLRRRLRRPDSLVKLLRRTMRVRDHTGLVASAAVPDRKGTYE
jgi:hypothetical protein